MAASTFNASSREYPLKNAFILDSGSTVHICNNISRIEHLREPVIGDCIWAGNTQVWIQGYGTVYVKTQGVERKHTLRLDNVAWCPDLLCNLVSFRLLRRQGIWWDNKQEPTTLRR